MTTKNSREVEERFRNKILDVETAIRLTYNEKDSDQMVQKMLDFLHQELQKAREESRWQTVDELQFISETLNELDWSRIKYQYEMSRHRNQSELDQPTEKKAKAFEEVSSKFGNAIKKLGSDQPIS